MDSYHVCCWYDLHLDRSVVAFSINVRYSGTACVYFSFRWDPFVHSLGIVQWNSTRRDHPGNPGGVSGSGPVTFQRSYLQQLYLQQSYLKYSA